MLVETELSFSVLLLSYIDQHFYSMFDRTSLNCRNYRNLNSNVTNLIGNYTCLSSSYVAKHMLQIYWHLQFSEFIIYLLLPYYTTVCYEFILLIGRKQDRLDVGYSSRT